MLVMPAIHSASISTKLLEGMSRGGLIIYGWAVRNPQKVSCVYADAPCLGIRPYVRDVKPGQSPPSLVNGWLKAHGLTVETAKTYDNDVLDLTESLAKADVPLLHVCGDADEAVPFDDHTVELQKRYQKQGGDITVIVKKGGKHHPHSLKDPAPIVDFILASQK